MLRNRVLGYRAQTRSRIVAYCVTFTLLLVLMASMQVALLGRWRPLGAVPDLMLVTVLGIAFFSGQYAGAITGIGAGFLIEAMGSQGITLLPVVYMVGAYVAGHYARTVKKAKYPAYLFYLGCALLLRAGVTVTYTALTYQTLDLVRVLLYAVLPEMLVTALAGLVSYFPIGIICRLLARKK